MTLDVVRLPDNAAADLRRRLGLAPDETPRIAFIGGTGDISGTYLDWRAGKHDPRVPKMTYSAMFYQLIEEVQAHTHLISGHPPPPDPDPGFSFAQVTRRNELGTSGFGYFRREAAYGREVAAALDDFAPHVIVVHSDYPKAFWPALRRRGKVVLTAHNTFWPMGAPPTGIKDKIKLAVLRWAGRGLDGAICTSPECARQIAEITNGRVQGRYQFPQMMTRFPIQERSQVRRLLFLGRIEENKGVFMLMRAFEALSRDTPELELEFAGTGTAQDRLQAQIDAVGSDRIRFLGLLDSEGVHQAIARSDLVVCPTTTGFAEGLALVGFESAAHGIPSIMSSVVPAADLLGEAGVVFPADDTQALTQALRRVIDDPAAYRRLLDGTQTVREGLYDLSRSWGSQLGRVLLEL